jgi:putative lipoic acid-binding regulatory protein
MTNKESRFPAPGCAGRRQRSTASNESATPLVPLALLDSPNRGRQVACGSEPEASLLEFPCRFPVKAMGRHSADFESVVSGIVSRHASLWPEEPIRSVPSKAGNFVSVTAVVHAQSKKQLDAIYQDLTDCEQVLMAL